MGTLKETNLTNVFDDTEDNEGNKKVNLNYFNGLSENARLEFDPLTFEAYGKTMRATNRQIATIVREYYAKTFHDLRGVNVVYNPGQPAAPFELIMYFAKNSLDVPTNKISNLTDLTVVHGTNTTSLYYLKQAVDNKAVGKHYTLNDQTKLLLGDIMFGGKGANKPKNVNRWNAFISEVPVQTSNWAFDPRSVEVLIQVKGCFDFHRVLKKIFGGTMVTKTDVTKNQDGRTMARNTSAEAAYEARFIKYAFNDPNVFIMNIEQFDKAAVEELVAKENPISRAAVSGVVYF